MSNIVYCGEVILEVDAKRKDVAHGRQKIEVQMPHSFLVERVVGVVEFEHSHRVHEIHYCGKTLMGTCGEGFPLKLLPYMPLSFGTGPTEKALTVLLSWVNTRQDCPTHWWVAGRAL